MGLGSSIASAVQANKARKQANAEYQQKTAMLDNMFNKDYYSDITQRTDIQNMLRVLQENQDKQASKDNALAAITGATSEAQLAAQESRNKSYADSLASIASNASTLKDTYKQNYLNQRMNMNNPQTSILQNSSNMWGQAGANLFGSGAKLMGSGLDDIIGKKGE